MTVKELRERFTQFDENMIVTVIDAEGRFRKIEEIFEGYNIEGKVIVID